MPTAHSSESGRTYQLDRLIGKGGFGEVYLATPTPQDGLPSQVCVKITERLSGWLREAYFAELLFREPRALRVFDRFVEPDGERTRYCIALEYAMHGDLGVWLERKGAQSERFVRREIAAILQPLDILHRGQALHRDLTPFNVFVCEDEHLKEVIYRCLGARGKRYESARELISALRHRPKEPHLGRVVSLEGRRLSFTGFLTRPRKEAIAAAKKAGAIVVSKPGPTSDVLVRGRPNALQIAGTAGGTKLLEIRRLAARGHAVIVIGERQFWKLVEPPKRKRKPAKRRTLS